MEKQDKDKRMVKVSPHTWIDEPSIESVSAYGSRPLNVIAEAARKEDKLRDLFGSYGFKSVIIMDNDFVYRCPNNPDIYISRMNEEDWYIVETKRAYIRKTGVREVTDKLNASQKRDLSAAKKAGKYVNLAKNQKVRFYVFMKNGRVYGTRVIRPFP